ncbi:MAG: cupin domain-containing protein [Candidatus Omnitrophica bacterium]|nr:cupin domain-containing protein [Candidatus Omnitrophota bacterium]
MPQVQTETRVKIEKPTENKLAELKVKSWPIWTKEASTFDWSYDATETCYFLEGEVTVKTDRGEVSFGKGDLVTFPKGLSCTWNVKKPVRKHYQFS